MTLIDPVQLCPDCEVIRTPRSRHCGICDQCVERYDHHCPWLNTCVGVGNHRPFIFFIFFLMVTLGHVLGMTTYSWINIDSDAKSDFPYLIPNLDRKISESVSLMIITFTLFFTFAITSLFVTQLKNFMSNRTTNERFSRKAYRSSDSMRSQSMVSMTTSILAEELVNDLGRPKDIGNPI